MPATQRGISQTATALPVPNLDKPMQRITLNDTAQALEAGEFAFDARTEQVLVQVQGGDAVFSMDGTAPAASAGVATAGFILQDGSSQLWAKEAAQKARFVRLVATASPVVVAGQYLA